ncbi:MAG: hypothetical protein SW019_09155 [Actinomycetota bacterium]|nr:hypothetical protein [Actinomycetota bacterium]
MTGRDRDDAPPAAWHNRTSTLLGASVAALVVLAVLVWSISYVVRQAGEPEPAPTNFVEPTYSVTDRSVSTPTTTATITSTSPPVTTDINPEPVITETTESGPSTLTTRPPRTKETDLTATTTRQRPRLTQRTTSDP